VRISRRAARPWRARSRRQVPFRSQRARPPTGRVRQRQHSTSTSARRICTATAGSEASRPPPSSRAPVFHSLPFFADSPLPSPTSREFRPRVTHGRHGRPDLVDLSQPCPCLAALAPPRARPRPGVTDANVPPTPPSLFVCPIPVAARLRLPEDRYRRIPFPDVVHPIGWSGGRSSILACLSLPGASTLHFNTLTLHQV
jgi:hypothetical protein